MDNPANPLQNDSDFIDVPQHAIETLARCFLPSIQTFFESEKGKREFEEW